MYSKPINLLPSSEVKHVHKEYLVRLWTVVIIALSILVLIQIALLFPSYRILKVKHNQLNTTYQYLSQITAQNIASIKIRINTLNKQATLFSTLSEAPSATAAIKQVLSVDRAGIVLKGITYTAPKKGKQAQIIIGGIASDRRTLQIYQELLQSTPYISSAHLPVSVYAKDTNIKFSMTLIGSFLP